MTHHGTPLKRMGLDLRETPIAGRRMNFEALLRRGRAVGLQRLPERVLDADLGARLPGDVRVARGRLPAQRRARHRRPRRTCSACAASSGSSPARPPSCTRRRTASTRADTCPCSTSRGSPTRSAPTTWCWPACTTSTMPTRTCASSTRSGRIRDVAAHPSIEELCLAADVLVTDYSSIMFDYAVLDRPIVIHAPDWEVYRALRGTYFDLMAEPPGVVARTEDELVEALRSRSAWGEEATRLRAAFRARFCSLDDGRAAERVVRPSCGRSDEPADPRRRRRPQRHEPAVRDARPARLPHPAARGQGRRHQPARVRRAALGRRLPHPPAARAARDAERRAPRRVGEHRRHRRRRRRLRRAEPVAGRPAAPRRTRSW